MNYQQTLAYLLQKLPMFQRIGGAAYKANLENIKVFCEALGNPQEQFRSVHIAGTNGKGSTAHSIASILQEAGYKVGLTTSPHLKNFTERIKINGLEIPQQAVVSFVAANQHLIEELKPSFFEVSIAMAFWHFATQQIDVAVVEVGMGGRLDSTNIITPLLSVITHIGYDHQQFLGDTLAAIAGEKAGIIKPQIPVVITEKHPETAPVFVEFAEKNESKITFAEDVYQVLSQQLQSDYLALEVLHLPTQTQQNLLMGLLGAYQAKNILGILAAMAQLQEHFIVEKEHITEGLKNVVANTQLKGRWQVLQKEPMMVCDIAHNKTGLTEVVRQIKQYDFEKLHLVLGFMSDKDVDAVLPLFPSEAYFYFCQPPLERAMSVEILLEKAQKLGLQAVAIQDVNEAIAQAKQQAKSNDFIYIGGSTFVVAEIDEGTFG